MFNFRSFPSYAVNSNFKVATRFTFVQENFKNNYTKCSLIIKYETISKVTLHVHFRKRMRFYVVDKFSLLAACTTLKFSVARAWNAIIHDSIFHCRDKREPLTIRCSSWKPARRANINTSRYENNPPFTCLMSQCLTAAIMCIKMVSTACGFLPHQLIGLRSLEEQLSGCLKMICQLFPHSLNKEN